MSTARVTRRGLLDMEVCVPKEFTDDQIREFANAENLCGTTNGWQIRRQGDEALSGDDERVQCEQDPSCVHIMLDA